MKTSMLIAALLLSGLTAPAANTPTTPVQDPSLPAPTPFRIVNNDANSRVWQRETYEKRPDGHVMTRIHKYMELATRLYYQDANGQWQESQDEIDAYASGAIAQKGPYQVIFANNLNSAGSIDMQTPDGKRLRSNILGLMYHDTSTGDAVMIAQVQDSTGQLISANQVLYPKAFQGVKADVRYTYKKGSFEQDVILREQPPTPESYGLNPATTEIEVMTEFLNPPPETIKEHSGANGAEPDQDISWGTTRIGHGKAFDLGEQPNSRSHVSVTKQYQTVNGRKVLLEKVPLKNIQPGLQGLPLHAAIKSKLPKTAFKSLVLPRPLLAQTIGKPMKLAAASPSSQGYVLDYVEINTYETDYTFQADTTYLISGYVYSVGTLTFEGGTVVKIPEDGSGGLASTGNIQCDTSTYQPAIFTSVNDDSVGESLPGSTGMPATGGAVYFEIGTTSVWLFQHCRFSYAGIAMIQYWGDPVDFNDVQFVQCYNGVFSNDILVENALVSGGYYFSSSGNAVFENVTFDQAAGAVSDISDYFTNCIFSTITNIYFDTGGGTNPYDGANNGFYCSPEFGANAVTNTFNPYQTAGAGSYYLTNGCAFRNAGTTNIDPALLADLATKTTYPPMIYSNTAIVGGTYPPQAQRDTNGSPDLGYHYDPLDYCFSGVNVATNILFPAGTAVGYFDLPDSGGYGYGLGMPDSSFVTYAGTLATPCVQARYNTVQEGNGNWLAPVGLFGGVAALGSNWTDPTLAATIDARFTLFASLATQFGVGQSWTSDIIYRFTHCVLNSGAANSWGVKICMTNCLLVGVVTGNYDYGSDTSCIFFQNCTLREGTLFGGHFGGSTFPVHIQNCAFEGMDLSQPSADPGDCDPGISYYDYNAFITNSMRLPLWGTHDVTNFVAYNWQTSWLGNYYLPTNSLLINAGSTTADQFGLYHFTTQTNQVKETNSIVDIGYHYVAVDADGNPIDSTGNGVPDYIKDSNGDGIQDDGELPWDFPFVGLKLWLKADAGVTFGVSNRASLWADQSGNGNDAMQSTSSDRPFYLTNVVNALPSLFFNGTNAPCVGVNNYFNLPNTLLNGATGAEAFVVLKVATNYPSGPQPLWEMGGEPLASKAFPDTDGSIKDDFGSSAMRSLGQPAAPLSEFNVYQVSSQATGWKAWFNGILQYQTSVNTVQFPAGTPYPSFYWYNLGAAPYYTGTAALANYFDGEVSEVLVFNRELNTSERNAVNGYLDGKYGLTPTVAITGPTNNEIFQTGANIGISASAFESGGGTIKQVEFFQGSTSLGVCTGSTYSVTWNNVAFGGTTRSNYSLTACATGVNGLITTSSVVNIYVDPPPTTSITNPVGNAYLGIAPVNVTINASVGDFMGISQVQFFQGTNSLGVDTSPPYAMTWSNAPTGTYTFTAITLADDGLMATNSIGNVFIDTDSDGDGLGNLQESLYGTNPNGTDSFGIWTGTPSGLLLIP